MNTLNKQGSTKEHCCEESRNKPIASDSTGPLLSPQAASPPANLVKCGFCANSYISLRNMRRHQKRLHPGKNPVTCSVCQEIIPWHDQLKDHYEEKHPVPSHPVPQLPQPQLTILTSATSVVQQPELVLVPNQMGLVATQQPLQLQPTPPGMVLISPTSTTTLVPQLQLQPQLIMATQSQPNQVVSMPIPQLQQQQQQQLVFASKSKPLPVSKQKPEMVAKSKSKPVISPSKSSSSQKASCPVCHTVYYRRQGVKRHFVRIHTDKNWDDFFPPNPPPNNDSLNKEPKTKNAHKDTRNISSSTVEKPSLDSQPPNNNPSALLNENSFGLSEIPWLAEPHSIRTSNLQENPSSTSSSGENRPSSIPPLVSTDDSISFSPSTSPERPVDPALVSALSSLNVSDGTTDDGVLKNWVLGPTATMPIPNSDNSLVNPNTLNPTWPMETQSSSQFATSVDPQQQNLTLVTKYYSDEPGTSTGINSVYSGENGCNATETSWPVKSSFSSYPNLSVFDEIDLEPSSAPWPVELAEMARENFAKYPVETASTSQTNESSSFRTTENAWSMEANSSSLPNLASNESGFRPTENSPYWTLDSNSPYPSNSNEHDFNSPQTLWLSSQSNTSQANTSQPNTSQPNASYASNSMVNGSQFSLPELPWQQMETNSPSYPPNNSMATYDEFDNFGPFSWPTDTGYGLNAFPNEPTQSPIEPQVNVLYNDYQIVEDHFGPPRPPNPVQPSTFSEPIPKKSYVEEAEEDGEGEGEEYDESEEEDEVEENEEEEEENESPGIAPTDDSFSHATSSPVVYQSIQGANSENGRSPYENCYTGVANLPSVGSDDVYSPLDPVYSPQVSTPSVSNIPSAPNTPYEMLPSSFTSPPTSDNDIIYQPGSSNTNSPFMPNSNNQVCSNNNVSWQVEQPQTSNQPSTPDDAKMWFFGSYSKHSSTSSAPDSMSSNKAYQLPNSHISSIINSSSTTTHNNISSANNLVTQHENGLHLSSGPASWPMEISSSNAETQPTSLPSFSETFTSGTLTRNESKGNENDINQNRVEQSLATIKQSLKQDIKTPTKRPDKVEIPKQKIPPIKLSKIPSSSSVLSLAETKKKPISNSQYLCLICKKTLSSARSLTRHETHVHKKKVSTSIISNSSDSNHLRMKIKIEPVESLEGIGSSSKKSMSKVSKSSSKSRDTDFNLESKFYCEKCNLNFDEFLNLQLHQTAIHSGQLDNFKPSKVRKITNLTCKGNSSKGSTISQDMTEKMTPSTSKANKNQPDKESRFRCETCDISFKKVVYKREHFKRKHTIRVPVRCEQCGKMYCDEYKKRRHLKNCPKTTQVILKPNCRNTTETQKPNCRNTTETQKKDLELFLRWLKENADPLLIHEWLQTVAEQQCDGKLPNPSSEHYIRPRISFVSPFRLEMPTTPTIVFCHLESSNNSSFEGDMSEMAHEAYEKLRELDRKHDEIEEYYQRLI